MAIELFDSDTVTMDAGAGTTQLIDLGTAPPSGSFILVSIVASGGTARTFTTPDNSWVLIHRQNNGTNPANGCYYKIAGPSEPTTYTFMVDSAQATTTCCVVLKGVNQNDPIDGIAGANGTTGTTITYGNVTTSTTGGLLVKTAAARNASGPAVLIDEGVGSTIWATDSNTTPVCMMGSIIADAYVPGPDTVTPTNAELGASCQKATISFVLNEAISPPISWLGV